MTSATPTTARPTDLAALRDAVLDSAGTLAVAGAGTAAGWAGELRPVDTVLDTTGLSGIVVHNPGDMTVAVRAGTPLTELSAALAEHGQRLAVDAARTGRGATVGGLVATADAGPSALVHGTMRDLVIGMTLVLADGTVARSGGHVIKNVSGYDLAKLMHGSYGTLGVLAEIVLRLHPVPEATATVALDCPLAEATGHAARLLAQPLEPAALEWRSTAGAGAGRLLVRLDGTARALPGRLRRVRDVLGSGATEAGPDEWTAHADAVRGGPQQAVLRIGARPSRVAELVAGLPGAAEGSLTVSLGTGVATAALPADPAGIAAAHVAVHAAGGTSVLRDRPPGLDAPPWGPPPSAVAVLRAVKTALDPDDRLGPGRFAGWLEENQ